MLWFYVLLFFSSYLTADQLNEGEFNFNIRQFREPEHSTAYLFAHGLGATQNQGITLFSRIIDKNEDNSLRFNDRWLINEPLVLFNFADAKNDDNEYFRKKVNLGQDEDTNRLALACQKTKVELPNFDMVLTGISRGSATIINYVAQEQPDYVKALILESPFDSLSSIVRHLLDRYCVSWVPFSEKIGYKICQKHFPSINPQGTFPLHTIEKVPHTIPVMFVHSKKDKVVPIKSSRRLYIKLKQAGHENVYLVELASGAHGKLINGPDGDAYLYAVHAFYKKYGLPHNPELAVRGQQLLSICQPSVEEVAQRLRKRNQLDENNTDENEEDDDLLSTLNRELEQATNE
ncbi:MAG: prolyl oligopeptidase family serine peptidase [Candidatus Babeliales bacterium]